ncbi:hypothetical protein HQ590_15400, partial [bacterium]|nr:hypothetical protein [bacterium]
MYWHRWHLLLLLPGLAGAIPTARAVTPLPTPARIALSYGVQALRSYQLADAEESFREALELEPHDVDTHQYLGVTLIVAGCREAGLQELWTAAGLRAKSTKYRVALARDLLRMGLVPEAEQFMRDAIRVDAVNTLGYQALIQLLYQLDRKIEALEIAQLATRGLPNDPPSHLGYAQLLLEFGCLEAAEEVLRRTVADSGRKFPG